MSFSPFVSFIRTEALLWPRVFWLCQTHLWERYVAIILLSPLEYHCKDWAFYSSTKSSSGAWTRCADTTRELIWDEDDNGYSHELFASYCGRRNFPCLRQRPPYVIWLSAVFKIIHHFSCAGRTDNEGYSLQGSAKERRKVLTVKLPCPTGSALVGEIKIWL